MDSSQDYYLKFMADNADMVVISVGYRLAPEHPFPQGPEDCYDVAEYLVQNGKSQYGGDLAFMGGEVSIPPVPSDGSSYQHEFPALTPLPVRRRPSRGPDSIPPPLPQPLHLPPNPPRPPPPLRSLRPNPLPAASASLH